MTISIQVDSRLGESFLGKIGESIKLNLPGGDCIPAKIVKVRSDSSGVTVDLCFDFPCKDKT